MDYRRWTMDSFMRSVLILSLACVAVAGCATPQYAVRPAPMPEESAEALQIERTISAAQAESFERAGARSVGPDERPGGLEIQRVIDRLSRVTERPSLRYRALLYQDRDPNAAALADGRIYLSTGMVQYLTDRGGREAELAFILGHEIAHTAAQHLVKRFRLLQQQQLLMSLVAAGAAAAGNAGGTGQSMGQLAMDAASLLSDVANSGYSQDQELEADQLGIRYVIRAGFDPRAALALLDDFARFDDAGPFLRTHPYITTRREHLARYLADSGHLQPSTPLTDVSARRAASERRRHLLEAQALYPAGSLSWKNLQRQIEELDRSGD